MRLRTTATDGAPKAIGPYSQAIAVGAFVYCAGQGAIDPATMANVTGDVTTETERTIDNLTAGLAAAGSDLAHVVETTALRTDMAAFAATQAAYAQRIGHSPPTRSTR